MKRLKLAASACLLTLGLNASADTVAYWQAQDGAAGSVAASKSSLKSQVNSPELDAVVCPDGRIQVAFSEDVPGKVIVAGADQTVVNADNTASAKTTPKGGAAPALTVAGSKLPKMESFTVEAFVKFETLPTWGNIVGKRRHGGFSWLLQQFADKGLLRARVDSNVAGDPKRLGFNQGFQTTFNLLDGQWHHIAATYEAATQKFTLYGDYQAQGGSKTTQPIVVDDQPLIFFDGIPGQIDEIRISDAALAPADFLKVK